VWEVARYWWVIAGVDGKSGAEKNCQGGENCSQSRERELRQSASVRKGLNRGHLDKEKVEWYLAVVKGKEAKKTMSWVQSKRTPNSW